MLRIVLGVGALALALFVAAGLLLSQGKTLGERHAAADLAEQFDYTLSFADHITYSRRQIQASRLDKPSATVIANLAPFMPLLGKAFSKAAWFEVRPDEAVYRYESFPFTAAAETWALIAATRAALAERTHDVPVFTVATLQDNTVSMQATLDYRSVNTDPRSRTLLYSQYPYAVSDRIIVVNSSAPEQDVLSVSHLGLMTPASHPHYGRDGAYRNCDHYFAADATLFARCKNGDRAFYGDATAENLQFGLVERIAFNPFYVDMVKSIDAFTATIEQ